MAKLRFAPRVNRSRLVRSLFPFPTDVYGVAGTLALWLLFSRRKRGAPPSSAPPSSAPPDVKR